MKAYRLFTIAMAAMFAFSCTDLSNPLEDINIIAQSDEGVTVDNNVITVQRNTPVRFSIEGEPDNITFYSGELDHNYDFRNRIQIDQSQIKSSVLSFNLNVQWGNAARNANSFSVYYNLDTFPGLDKSDFEADCNLLAEFAEWQELVSQADLPVTRLEKAKPFSIDLMPFLGKNVTFAVHYHPTEVDKDKTAQLRVEFTDFKIVNTLTNGSEVEISPADMGLTPVNLWAADLENASIDETNLKKNQGFYDESGNLIESAMWYGSVNNNTEGMWILNQVSSNNAFFVHSTGSGKSLHPSWLVSDYLVVNKTTPDTGTPIKNIANRLGEYEYTYTEPGTYKAVFVLNNANYKEEDSRIITMLINVK